MKTIRHLRFAFVLLLSHAALGQQPSIEYGRPVEMAGLTRVFVDTGADISLRNVIVAEIQKKLPKLVFTERETDAQLFLSFTTRQEPYVKNLMHEVATGYVALQPTRNTIRILMDFKDERANGMERKTTTNFARAFVKAYVDADKAKGDLQKNPYYKILTGQEKKPN